ncbi:MarR family winged helix-turn-helix transcriptional regulator [Solibacillus isronensis]|uniref:MarR family winged helix-turn-helix transcriptional regulator n=1 Tax=Solibacillus isronensis TaxID=412383 RepID=UPI0020401879|nr:winged helix DNA-binding protein [Solibacillus isronensis]MCM3722694.1 winged helix DNA-binding protein [Solibacillus isronensis]
MTFFLQLHRFHKRYTQRLTNILAVHELSNANWSLMHYLANEELATMSQIAKYWDVEKPTVSANVKTLTKQELIQMKQGNDRREKYISLTEKGERLYKNISPEIKFLQNQLLNNLSDEQQELFEKALSDMEKILKEGLE